MSLNLSQTTTARSNAGSLIRATLLKLGVINPTASISDITYNICLDALNRMIKHWQMRGVHLWTQHEGALVFDYQVSSYAFSDQDLSGGAVGMVNSSVLVSTTLTADAAAAATVLTVDSTTGMSATNKVLIQLEDLSRHATTIVSVDSATQITITSGLASAAVEDAAVYVYPVAVTQANLFYPKQIMNVRLHYSDNNETMLSELSRDGYMNRNDKTLSSTPFSYYIEDNLVNKKIYLFPVPENIADSLRFTYIKALDDINSLSNDVEFPAEWERTIVLNLAVEVAPEFGKEAKLPILAPLAAMALADAEGWDDEATSVQLIPELD